MQNLKNNTYNQGAGSYRSEKRPNALTWYRARKCGGNDGGAYLHIDMVIRPLYNSIKTRKII